MSLKILTQIIDYDNSTKTWGQYNNMQPAFGVRLIKHHDTQADAILAATPQLIQTWAANVDGDPLRIARGAAIALDRKAITHGTEPGTHQVISQNGNGTYTIAFDRCTCPDLRPGRQCKHELAVQARALLDDVTITLTTDCLVTSSNAHPITADEKLITVQEGTDPPRQARNPQFLTAVRWLLDRDYALYHCYWTQKPYMAVTHRTKRYHYIPTKEATK